MKRNEIRKQRLMNAFKSVPLLAAFCSLVYWTFFNSAPPKTSSEATLFWLLPLLIPTIFAAVVFVSQCCSSGRKSKYLGQEQAVCKLGRTVLISGTLSLSISNFFWISVRGLWSVLKPYDPEEDKNPKASLPFWILICGIIFVVCTGWMGTLYGLWYPVGMDFVALDDTVDDGDDGASEQMV